MLLIDQFRQDIENAITEFTQKNLTLSALRAQNIVEIRLLLQGSNPMKVCTKVTDYVNHLSSGIVALCFFMEVNRFKSALQTVLDHPHYQENAMLKRLIVEMSTQTALNGAQHGILDKNIHERIARIESSLSVQLQQMDMLRLKIKRLKLENQVLTKTITNLVEKNKHLAGECQTLKDNKAKIQTESDRLKVKYDQLLLENNQLKNKIHSIQASSESKKECAQSNNRLSATNPIDNPKNDTQPESSHRSVSQFFIPPLPKDLSKNKCTSDLLPGRRIQSLIIT